MLGHFFVSPYGGRVASEDSGKKRANYYRVKPGLTSKGTMKLGRLPVIELGNHRPVVAGFEKEVCKLDNSMSSPL